MTDWIKDKVTVGDRYGTKIGFPTINLNPKKLNLKISEGIYSSFVKINGRIFPGVLFLGPRLTKGESGNVLEIHILDFSGELYGKQIKYQIGKFIRHVKNFSSEADLKKEISNDIKKARDIAKKDIMNIKI